MRLAGSLRAQFDGCRSLCVKANDVLEVGQESEDDGENSVVIISLILAYLLCPKAIKGPMFSIQRAQTQDVEAIGWRVHEGGRPLRLREALRRPTRKDLPLLLMVPH